jgi:SAM-dependent methyltransferase
MVIPMVSKNNGKSITAACKAVELAFPIPDYLGNSWEIEMAHSAGVVLRHVRGDSEPPKLIDVGCGPMDKTAVFQTLGFDSWAIDDLSDPWVRRLNAEDKIREFASRLGIRFHLGTFEDHPQIPRNYFDVVTIFAVIEHLHESPRMLLNLAGELLRPGGLLYITMPNSVNLRKRVAVLTGRTNYPDCRQFFYAPSPWRGHVREYTLAEARWICEAAGWHVITASTFECLAAARLPAWLVPVFLLTGRFFPGIRSMLSVLARKPEDWKSVPEDPGQYRQAVRHSVPPGVA